eukprot:TRINITY_DN61141_c0_g1_i1.p1 TRINITY_DN61141_c0_g1~~TRINITY_DN61141_c0_g1_i1.p1  ORF type:complete len:622 (-),score=117.12 TRINITY_DN61141_c0_g1_i1:2-1816(-)
MVDESKAAPGGQSAEDESVGEFLLPQRLDELLRTVLRAQQEELLQCMDEWLARQRRMLAVRSSNSCWQEVLPEFADEPALLEPLEAAEATNRSNGNCAESAESFGVTDAWTESETDGVPNVEHMKTVDDRVMGGVFSRNISPSAQERWDMLTDHVGSAHSRGKLAAAVVRSWQFEALFACIVITNSVLIGVQVEYEAINLSESSKQEFEIISLIFTFLFTAELVLRMYVSGVKSFLMSRKGWFWNYLDLIIVISSLLEAVLQVVAWTDGENSSEVAASNGFRVMRISRLLRIARVFRVIKVIRFVQSLRNLCNSIISTLKALVSSLFLLLLIIYVFGILFTDSVTGYRLERRVLDSLGGVEESGALHVLIPRFGSLHLSMHTLFRSVSSGLDWDIAASALEHVSWAWTYVFTAFVVFCCFAVMNVMTAMFCQTAMETSQRDLDETTHKLQKDILHRIFDLSGVKTMTLQELETRCADPEVQACLAELELQTRDVQILFELLDPEKTNTVELDTFIECCWKIKSPISAIDLASLQFEGRRMRQTMKQIEITSQRCEDTLAKLIVSLKSLASRRNSPTVTSALEAPTASPRPLQPRLSSKAELLNY